MVEPKHEMYLNQFTGNLNLSCCIVEPKHEMYLNPGLMLWRYYL